MAWVFESSEATGNDRLLLLAIADESDDDGTGAYPSMDRLAAKVRLPKRTVMRCVERLEAIGELEVERPAQKGRGRFNRYRIVMKKGDTLTPLTDAEERRGKARKGAPSRTIGSRPIDPLTPGGASESDVTVTAGQDVAVAPFVDELCSLLADRIQSHAGDRPKITARWRRDMRLLVERGPFHVEPAEPLSVEKVRSSIGFVFDRLADRGSDGFCWADQIRSPHALRDHWAQLRLAARRIEQGRVSKGAQTIDRVANRLAGAPSTRTPLGLIPGGASERSGQA